MRFFSVQNLSYSLIKIFGLIVVLSFISINANGQKDEKSKPKDITEKSGVALDFMDEMVEEEEEINILKTFLYSNNDAFSITIYDFKDEKVKVFIYNSMTNERLHALNVEPKEYIVNVELLKKPLSEGIYHVVVQGETREIQKKMIIE